MKKGNTILLIISLFLIVLFSCIQKTKRKNDLEKICFAVGGCYGTCPYLSIEVDSTLTYKFYGGKHSKKIGWYKGNITQGFWDTLNINLERINYKNLDTTFDHSVDDASFEIILYYNNTRKHITAQEMSMPDRVGIFFSSFTETYKNLNLTKQTDSSFTIETKIQNEMSGILPPPIKFKPPRIKK